jgi:hypothetical protein
VYTCLLFFYIIFVYAFSISYVIEAILNAEKYVWSSVVDLFADIGGMPAKSPKLLPEIVQKIILFRATGKEQGGRFLTSK